MNYYISFTLGLLIGGIVSLVGICLLLASKRGEPKKPRSQYSKDNHKALIELVDGAYDIIEIHKAESPAQIAWKREWMSKAKELGANPSW